MQRKKANWTTVKDAKVSRTTASKKAAQRRLYLKARGWFLRAYPMCAVWCIQRGVDWRDVDNAMHAFAVGCPRSTEVHHVRGRNSGLLLNERHWLPVASENHSWIHTHIKEARALGLIAARGEWGKQ